MPGWERDEQPMHGRKKNTRRWCGGKVGREHAPALTLLAGRTCEPTGWYERTGGVWHPTGAWLCRHLLMCTRCGKRLAYIVPCPDKPDDLRQLPRPRQLPPD